MLENRWLTLVSLSLSLYLSTHIIHMEPKTLFSSQTFTGLQDGHVSIGVYLFHFLYVNLFQSMWCNVYPICSNVWGLWGCVIIQFVNLWMCMCSCPTSSFCSPIPMLSG